MKNKHQLVWGVILLGAIAILIGYSILLFMFAKNAETVVSNEGYYNSGMMGGRVNSNQNSSDEKLTPDQVQSDVENYLEGYGQNLEVAGNTFVLPMRITMFRWQRKILERGNGSSDQLL